MVNLRRYARLKTSVDITYRIAGFSKALRAQSVNIGLGGICFEAADNCKVGTKLELEIFIEKSNPIKVGGSVIWQKKFEDDNLRAGVRFDGLKEEDQERFSNFIFKKMYEMTGVGNRSGLVKYAKEHGWKEIKE